MPHKYRILVVDDDLKNIQVGINFLKKNARYHLVFATSGQQALERVKELEFDLILLDIIMPTMDGYAVCKHLKSDPKTKDIPVVFLTAKHDEESLVKGFEVGGEDYITKPFNAAELNARVKTHLKLHRQYKKEINKLKEIIMYSQKAETIRYLAGGIAHDCNNFMVSIPGNLFMLEKRFMELGTSLDDCRDQILGIKSAVKQVSGLLDQLADFSKREQTVCETVDLKEVVSDLKKVYKGYSQHNISFDAELLHADTFIHADKLHVEQVLLNIIINGQHAILDRIQQTDEAEHGNIRLVIDKCDGASIDELAPAKDYIMISIEDDGVGMTADTVKKIFDPYFSTRTDNGGTGLGLAVSLGIVQSHKGTIKVHSSIGEGSRFNVYLPAGKD